MSEAADMSDIAGRLDNLDCSTVNHCVAQHSLALNVVRCSMVQRSTIGETAPNDML